MWVYLHGIDVKALRQNERHYYIIHKTQSKTLKCSKSDKIMLARNTGWRKYYTIIIILYSLRHKTNMDTFTQLRTYITLSHTHTYTPTHIGFSLTQTHTQTYTEYAKTSTCCVSTSTDIEVCFVVTGGKLFAGKYKYIHWGWSKSVIYVLRNHTKIVTSRPTKAKIKRLPNTIKV